MKSLRVIQALSLLLLIQLQCEALVAKPTEKGMESDDKETISSPIDFVSKELENGHMHKQVTPPPKKREADVGPNNPAFEDSMDDKTKPRNIIKAAEDESMTKGKEGDMPPHFNSIVNELAAFKSLDVEKKPPPPKV